MPLRIAGSQKQVSDPAVGSALRQNVRRLDVDWRAGAAMYSKRPQIVDPDSDVAGFEQLLQRGIDDLDAGDFDGPADAQRPGLG